MGVPEANGGAPVSTAQRRDDPAFRSDREDAMSDPKPKTDGTGEPSMEEILASIRRIITDDGESGKPSSGPAGSANAAPASATKPMSAPVAETAQPAPNASDILELTDMIDDKPARRDTVDPLVDQTVAASASEALSSLAAARRRLPSQIGDPGLPLGNGGMTLESLVREEIRGLLKAWLDENLPPMVERLVQREIRRITRDVE
jgi:cell pole-organizing protein PopZ